MRNFYEKFAIICKNRKEKRKNAKLFAKVCYCLRFGKLTYWHFSTGETSYLKRLYSQCQAASALAVTGLP